ncbi:EGF domain-specific O-linked N-acetylglucosamine transferase-like [Diadema setosum]|uniref:EGF domain-specific O-linked N-acetylglucosamine transferase-like n=1 Tax=Diadema setosum TaxID=31175 RepID=UPI003B3A8BB0
MDLPLMLTLSALLTWLCFCDCHGDGDAEKFVDPDLPPSHYPYFFRNDKEAAKSCRQDASCPYKDSLDRSSCWGYEAGCLKEDYPSYPVCTEFARGWSANIEAQRDVFWTQADFGFIKNTLASMKTICQPEKEGDSMLRCSEFIRHCQVKNLYLDLRNLGTAGNRNRFSVEAFNKPGVVGGHCKLDRDYLKSQSAHFSELQSWYGELNEYTEVDFQPVVQEARCDITITRPTIFMKLDAGVNMYHHFCDFINLYMSQHINGSFTRDVNIVMWDASGLHYGDLFHDTWSAFSDTEMIPLRDWDGKRVCIADGVFSLLPRMQRGMYYNMPLVPHCHGSAMMRAFSQHLLHRLGVAQEGPTRGKIRVTLLDRKSKHRNIINQDELIAALRDIPGVEVTVIVYHWRNITFKEQLRNTQNSDIFIGMHGAGLTHLLFLPDWAVIFELCNCGDKNCYKDLAAIRGVKYITWQKTELFQKHNVIVHPSLGTPHDKFCDYEFDVPEFVRLMKQAITHVKTHPEYRQWVKKDEL